VLIGNTDKGDVSVIPYPIVTSVMFSLSTTMCISAMGQVEPAMIPVRKDETSKSLNLVFSRALIIIVGTPVVRNCYHIGQCTFHPELPAASL
jgi:hypothetical protein